MGRPEGRMSPAGTLPSLIEWLSAAPAGTTLDAASMLTMLTTIAPTPDLEPVDGQREVATWRERLWTVPAETRLDVRETAEALGKPVSYVYRHTSERAAGEDRLPFRKLDGELQFLAGELRTWLRKHEEVVVSGHIDGTVLPLNSRRAS